MKTTVLSICMLLICSAVQGAPLIQGTGGNFSDGQAVSVSGSGFGSHNMKIEWLGGKSGHIESATAGSYFAKSGWNHMPIEQYRPTYDTTRAYSGSKSIIFDSVKYGDGRIGISYDPGAPITFGYTSWMARIETGGASGQWKMFRINWERNVVDTGPEVTFFNWFGQTDQVLLRRSVTDRDRLYPSGYPESGEWVRLEMMLKPSSAPGRADGSVELWVHRPGRSIEKVVNAQNAVTYAAGETDRWRYFIYQNYQGNGLAGSSRVWLDDLYVQQTRARVELGNAATWSACTQREIQQPTSWSDSGLTFNLNQGTFRDGEQVYLYVVDGSGSVNSQGYPLTLGGSGSTPVPDPVVTDPVVTDPVVTDPVVTDPVVTDPVVTDPVVTDPVVTDPAPTEPDYPSTSQRPTAPKNVRISKK